MKKTYLAPDTKVYSIDVCAVLCGSAKGNADKQSIVVEEEETMVKSNSYNTNPVQWENWQ